MFKGLHVCEGLRSALSVVSQVPPIYFLNCIYLPIMCVSAHVEVRGQLSEGGSLLPSCAIMSCQA